MTRKSSFNKNKLPKLLYLYYINALAQPLELIIYIFINYKIITILVHQILRTYKDQNI